MKSYIDHLSTLLSQKKSSSTNRSSAIFPVIYNSNLKMKLYFLNYWQIKRDIDHLLCRVYLRNSSGGLTYKKYFYVDKIKSYEIDLMKILGTTLPFEGSLEIEFCSPENLVFPFPAVCIHYYNSQFSTFVHTSQRVYNDKKDALINYRKKIIESGFNIVFNDTYAPFITLINGEKEIKNKSLILSAINSSEENLDKKLKLSLKPYQSTQLHLDDWQDLQSHLNDKAGTMKLKLFDTNSFPRLIVGNRSKKNQSMSITHTYYDLSKESGVENYFKRPPQSWYGATLMLPYDPKQTSKVYFYPLYSPAEFTIDLEAYSSSGILIDRFESILEISKGSALKCLNLNEYANGSNVSSFRMIAKSDKLLPARIKIGFDVGQYPKQLPCNICTNFIPFNEKLLSKKETFKWTPMLLDGEIWIHNDSALIDYDQSANVSLTFYRECDTQTLTEKFTIKPFGTLKIIAEKNIKAFLNAKSGFCTINSDNPFITTFYFDKSKPKSIGGDHGF